MLFTKKQRLAIGQVIAEMNSELDELESRQNKIVKKYRAHQDKLSIKKILERIIKL